MFTRLHHLLVRTVALLALLVLLAGPMLLVAHLVGRPWPTGVQLRRAWHGGDLDWRVAAKLAAAGFWLLWGYLTAIALTEARQVLRGQAPAVSRTHVGGFGLAPVVRYLVRTVLAAGITVTTMIPIAASVAARPAAPPATHVYNRPATTVATRARIDPDPATINVTATGRDTPYSIAVRCCHDPAARNLILELNRGRPLPDGSTYSGGPFPAGWTVLVPADRAVPTTVSTAAMVGNEEYPIPIPAGEHVVEHGDNLWTIAQQHLQDVGLPAPTQRQVADYWQHTISDNQAHLASGNPNLIYPGEIVTLPVAGPAPAPPVSPATSSEPALPADTTLPSPQPPPTAPPTSTTSPTTTEPAPAADHATTPTTPPPSTPTTTSAAPSPTPHRSDPIQHTTDDRLRQLVLWTGGTVLATGTIAALTRNRRRRLATSPTRRLRPPDDDERDLELALRAAGQPDHLAWATTALRDLGTHYRPRPGQPQPASVQLTTDAIDILWTTPTPDPPAPWRTGDAGWSWHRDRHPNDPTTSDRNAPCPTLVTIGTRTDNPDATVLVHLETAGTLHLPTQLAGLARALIHELATTPFADDIDILITDPTLTPPGFDERVRTATLTDAIAWAHARTADTADNLRRRHHDHAFAARLTNTSLDGYQPVVIIATAASTTPELVDQLAGVCQPGTGASAIILGGPTQPWTITPTGTGHVHLAPLGIELVPVALTEADANDLDDLVTLHGPTQEPVSMVNDRDGEVVFADQPADVTVDADEDLEIDSSTDAEAFIEAPFDIEVHVLGQVGAVGGTQHLTPGELELLAYLALHPNGDTADTIMTQLWPTQPAAPKTFRNRCTNLRTKLGTGHDRQLLFPESRDTGLYRTSNLVTTDLARFRAHVRHAERASSREAIELLRHALALVTGPPFRASSGYDWAYAEQIEDHANHDIQHAASRLAELALEAEDPHTALWAAAQAKLALGVLAAEPLGRLEMLAHAHDGNTAAITDVYRALQTALEQDDPANDLAPETTALYHRLIGASATARSTNV